MPTAPQRLAVLKTYKLYLGGKFPRTESGRTMIATDALTGEHLAHYCHASRKDLRDAVVAARAAQPGWGASTAYLRGQILYRMAEMLESRRDAFISEIRRGTGASPTQSAAEVDATVDRLVWYAGWTDKLHQVYGAVNPVAGPYFNFTLPEPTGVVGIFAPDSPSLLGLVSVMASTILTGNAAVILASETCPLPAISFAEVLATSDLPGGVVNLLSGQRAELTPWLASHHDVNAVIDASGDPAVAKALQAGSAANLKRFANHACPTPADWFGEIGRDPYRILDTVEFKTAWHPIGV
ncbi:MAG: aldehyde dehydrogenase family protein [Verrucomicrobiales bacterium]|nr:aldehyde dehydrogenase family protein [Verrucomicrobiales bacterium]